MNSEVSPWVKHCLARHEMAFGSPVGKSALDLACGAGRHARHLAALGFQVHAVDRLKPEGDWGPGIEFEQLDLEQESWPLSARCYDVIVVSNYLYRPQLPALLACLKPQGVLVYETFMDGNAQFGSPRNPDFLLKPGELLSLGAGLQVLAFEQGLRTEPSMAMIQRIMCIKGDWSEIQSRTHLEKRRD